ncbi:TetR/AcrR family transcriptional regulator [Paenibacillus contaminans]|uniref:TetR/AcrR family transcriptional regulator n=1 Tax=Paenibacillus contaminans TaxID=450362 RepID=A0A329LRL1_9BACL|nr:TetR/AcrR family transcriptional regulator [Paenibacillus contaminans]RAV10571.1 TetR/AcrR family transcriptional regulator [Paenibacillus contaminans]
MSTDDKRKYAQQLSGVILNTARSLFEEHGVDAVSMHQVAKSAGIGQGTLYRRYANKGDLCLDLMKDRFRHLSEDWNTYLKQNADTPAVKRLRYLMRSLIHFVEKDADWIATIQSSTACSPDRLNFFETPPYVYMFTTICTLFEEAANMGEMAPVQAPFVTHMLISCLSPVVHLHLRQVHGYTTEQIADYFSMYFIDPLFKRTS